MMLQHNQSSIFTCESLWRFTSVMTSQVSVANPTVTFIKGPKNNCLIINHHCKPGNRIYFATKHQSGTKYSQLWVFVLAQNSNVKTTSQCLESFFYNPPPPPKIQILLGFFGMEGGVLPGWICFQLLEFLFKFDLHLHQLIILLQTNSTVM